MSASGSAKDGAGCPGCSMCADSIPNHFSFDNSSLRACRASATRPRSYNSWMTLRLLGGLTPRTFLRRYWQKRPLFVRGALPAFRGVVDEHALAALAARDDVESRLVERSGRRWNTAYGPFTSASLTKINSTLLVSGVNLHVEAADRLLRRFDFVPQARLDDVMVSFATRGGGVGPHVDSYDVFLLQASGRRRWRVGRKTYVVEPGDLLYVPPGWRHDGVALEPCFTYSIGFRAPSDQEVAREFLAFLQDRVAFDGTYADRGAKPQRRPAEVPKRMVRQAAVVARRIRWRVRDVARFLGEYLSAPKPQTVFSRPRTPRSPARFAALCRARGLRLDLRTRMLFREREFFVNGERVEPPGRLRRFLARLADERVLPPGEHLPQPLLGLLHDWYLAGW